MRTPDRVPGRLHIEVALDYSALSARAARLVVKTLQARPTAVLSLTTGRTVAGLYQLLCAFHRAGTINLAMARIVSSEEYAGISEDDGISLFGWLYRDLLGPCGVPDKHILRFAGDASDLETECRRFDEVLAAWGGPDLVVQTVGVNGHFGFNEPEVTAVLPSRPVQLARSTLAINRAYWTEGAPLPRIGLTMGVAQTVHARQVLLIAHGAHKAQALARALYGPIDGHIPCSLLRLAPRLTVLADARVARRLPAGTAVIHSTDGGIEQEV